MDKLKWHTSIGWKSEFHFDIQRQKKEERARSWSGCWERKRNHRRDKRTEKSSSIVFHIISDKEKYGQNRNQKVIE